MKQHGLAVASFQSAKQKMPPAMAFVPVAGAHVYGTTPIVNWPVPLLSEFGRNDLSDLYSEQYRTATAGSAIAILDGQVLEFLVCPSDPVDVVGATSNPLSYFVNGGIHNQYGFTTTTSVEIEANGAWSDNAISSGNMTALLDRMKDGASNTILVAERVQTSLPIKWNFVNSVQIPSDFEAAILWNSTNCDAGMIPVNSTLASGAVPSATNSLPSSNHFGGVNVCFVDGSVKFLDENVDGTVLGRLMSSNGAKANETPNMSGAAPNPPWQIWPIKGTELSL
ncbi:DUF1559 domain-containing protein [Blastopirellula sp. JC732]|uniref:DUF1559 domain-containing protein n=2 Tax=Blastopirellula sediminis TaxID=2894196 RepID=A0A9X1MI14_9BACT|nr:DUF1559 domain-containing protein [Blastopirellula sediminis]MCC9627563.1 DUF1559 domain-containing protein [Blastopirellula sediminis]